MANGPFTRWVRHDDTFMFHRDGNDALALELNRLFDAERTGLPAPGPSTSLSAEERARLEPFRQTVTTAFTLARQADQERQPQDEHDKQQIWEQIMTTAHFPQTVTLPAVQSTTRVPNQLGRRFQPRGADRPFERSNVINAVLITCLVFMLAAGAWFTGQGFTGDSGGKDPVQFGLAGQLAATPGATPDLSSIAPIDWPTADDCTVTPLTVDEVIAILRDPVGFFIGRQAPATPTAVEAEATRTANLEAAQRGETGTVTPGIMEQVVATQREWVACTMKGSYFQKWALEYPVLVAEQVEDALPLFTTEAQARTLLAQLEAEGRAEGFLPPVTTYNLIPLIDPDPANSMYSVSADGSWGMVWASEIQYDESGAAIQRGLFLPEGNSGGYQEWRFTSLNDDGPWLIEQVGGFRG